MSDSQFFLHLISNSGPYKPYWVSFLKVVVYSVQLTVEDLFPFVVNASVLFCFVLFSNKALVICIKVLCTFSDNIYPSTMM